MKDELGNRMKDNYENVTRNFLPRRAYTIIRLDVKAFHTFTKGLDKPFDDNFHNLMFYTAENLCQHIQGVKFLYTQSDEISLLLTDFDKIETQAWFSGNIQKMVSVSASMATFYFMELMIDYIYRMGIKKFISVTIGETTILKHVMFDSRVFTIPSKTEVINYFIWRQKDCIRNSINSLGQNLYSHKLLKDKNQEDVKQMCSDKGISWEQLPKKYKYGTGIYVNSDYGTGIYVNSDYEKHNLRWNINENLPVFTEDRDFLNKIIPDNV